MTVSLSFVGRPQVTSETICMPESLEMSLGDNEYTIDVAVGFADREVTANVDPCRPFFISAVRHVELPQKVPKTP